ncbi:hypothetical protein Poli38472_009935 [Pythium oligandrum]|uniref:EF-hand domain-containing protein n=1 Tax=Pythium oligandrum TaxID=41045 RepID=A0A8K1C8I5_PYTOL|nr:hypothetical protein Poli38472_009935 [Pythium oligandrum]|eukprot:TMW58376.1 hypothetical protein Poli38472_009935 [Pythium oligandrum]
MGQLHGKAAYAQAATPFLNASEKDVNKLWEAFNDVAEGFGLNQDEMCEICRSLMPTLEIHAKIDMDQLTIPLFNAFDTDENGLVDALEFLGTIAIMSAMTIRQKLTFVYNCYDFNESSQISIDELTLALRSTLTGLCKLSSGVLCPTELVLEDMALHAFHKAQKHGPEDYLILAEFLKFAETTPEMTSWIDYFDSPGELVETNDRDDSDLEVESAIHPLVAGPDGISDDLYALKVRQRDPGFPQDAKAPYFYQDEPAPAQPWQAAVPNAAPSAPPTLNPNAPAAGLELDWIYGFNSDLRNIVKYVTPAEIVYPAGNVAVLYDVIEHKQCFVFHHSDLVQCVAVHPVNRHIVATGERGAIPKIVVWNTNTLGSTLSAVRGFHRQGVAHLAWMPNGRTLISVGQDAFNCVAVYQWETMASASTTSTTGNTASIEWNKPPALIFTGRCGREPVHACVVLSATQFVTSGRRHLFFWARESDERYTSEHALFYKRPGVLGRKAKVQTLLSLAPVPGDASMVLAGSTRGQILVFEGRNCIKVLYAHATAVNVLQAFPGGILSGGKDGKIRFWSKRLEPGAQFDMEALGSISSRVRSLVPSPDGGAKLLVATSGAEIYEIAASDGSNLHFGAMLSGHFAYELHGLAMHPTKREFCTTGDDKTVRIWDMNARRVVRMALLDAPTRACAYSPDGSLLAIGQGAPEDAELPPDRLAHAVKRLNHSKQGAFAVLSEATLAVKYEAKDSKKYIRNVRFSGDGLTLGVNSNDAFVFLYNTDDWASKGKCKARDTSAVLSHFDFATTGEYILANATNKGEMVVFESASGVEITRLATVKDVEWLTTSCIYGWAVQGVWPTTATASRVSAMGRSTSAGNNAPLLVVGDTDGRLRLYRYPCVSPQALAYGVAGGSSALARVSFSSDNQFVVSIAQEERCVFQWRVEYEEEDFASTLASDGLTPLGPTALTEYETHPTSDDEAEESRGEARTPFQEAATAGEYALELLEHKQASEVSNETTTVPAAVPVRPWVASAVAPADAPDEKDSELSSVPHESLELEWVYGYRAHDARNNLFASRIKPWLVYPAAHVVVILDTKLWLQRHFKQHTDEVTALAMYFGNGKKKSTSHPTTTTGEEDEEGKNEAMSGYKTLELVASGQMGVSPVIHVWRVDTMEVLSSLRGFHRHGIAELRFNPTGNLLASVGLDQQNSLAVYDWASGILLAHSVTGIAPGRVLGLAFEQDTHASMLCTVGVKRITFWRLSGHHLVKKDALLGKKGVLQSFLAVVFCGKDALVGTTSGDLYRFKGVELASIVPAHTRSIAALYCVPKSPFHVVSGGKDGLVKLWSADLECLAEFSEFNTSKYAIRSVFWDFDKNKLVIGTRGSSIHQLSSLDGSQILPKTSDGLEITTIEAHSYHELHGLGVCPSKERFCTTGDDAILRVWDFTRHVQILAKSLDTASRACAYSYDGDFIAVGLGSGATGKRHKKDGSLLVFEDRGASVELVYETRDTKQSINVVQYSPDNQSLVVGALDNCVYIYDVPNNYTKRAVFNKHKAWITHIDIASDSQYIRSNCGAFELLFADITTGSHVASASALKNQQWETCSTVYNWSNQGIWPSHAAMAAQIQITTSAASVPGSSKELSGAVLAAGTSHGHLNLFKYPAFVKGAGYKTYVGHHGAIARVGFSGQANGAHCLSIGRSDRCIFQWRKTRTRMAYGQDDSAATGNASVVKDLDDDPDMLREGMFIPEAFVNLPPAEIKPFLSAIVPPSSETPEPTDAGGVAQTLNFELDTVFGLRSADVRNNAAYTKTKHVVYHTGCLAIHYDRRIHRQQFYRGHSRPIVSLAASRDGSVVATGEICGQHLQSERPRIHLWDGASCSSLAVLSAFHARAVSYLAFDTSHKLLASVGQDEFHSIAVYQSATGLWSDAALLASSRTTRQPVFFVCWVDDVSASPFHVVTGGKDHVTFWRLDAPTLVATDGVFGTKAQQQSVLCGASIGALVITGCLTGHLYVWESGVVTRAIPAHEGAVYAIHATSEGCVSGGKDGHIKFWSKTLTPMVDFSIHDVKPAPQSAVVRSLHWDLAEDRVLVGTKGGELLEFSRVTKDTSLVTESHFDHTELVAIDAHPQRPELVVTAGEDQTVRVWDLTRREVVVKLTLDGGLRSVAYSTDGKWIAVGFGSSTGGPTASGANKDGAFVILDAVTLEILHEGRDAKQSVLGIKFSPDLTLLALGSADHCVYFYSTLDNFALRFKFSKSSGKVLHLDFAADSSALRINSDVYELLFISTLDGTAITTPSSMKDTAWHTQSCVFSWPTQGLWDFAKEDEYVYAVTKAHSLPLLVSATNTGQVRVYNYPCLSKHSEQHILRGHSMNVSNVVFTCDDSRLVSIGSSDKSLLVWRVQRK